MPFCITMRKEFVRRVLGPELTAGIANTDVMFPNGKGRNWIQVAALSYQRQVRFYSNSRRQAVGRIV